ncbi:MAG: phosphotransferase [Chloroflexota bacterium]
MNALIHHLRPAAKIIETRPLTGGISAQTTLILFEEDCGEQTNWVVRTPATQAMFDLLKFLENTAVSAPAPRYFDDSGQFADDGLLVMSFIDGEMHFTPANPLEYANQLAEQLAAIHAIALQTDAFPFLEQNSSLNQERKNRPTALDSVFKVDQIKAKLEGWQPRLRNKPVLLHGDFWPGNALWHSDKLVAVIDWEDAHLGDPLMDLAKSRAELAWIFGQDVLHQFTQRYKALMPLDYSDLPFWDSLAALRFARLCDGDLDWFEAFFTEYGRYDLTSTVVTQRILWFINQILNE